MSSLHQSGRRRPRNSNPLHDGELLRLGPFDIPQIGQRHVRVFLPPGYHHSHEHHPVLFMWDGQNVFDDAPSFAGGWHVHAAVAKRAQRRKTAPVVIALEHGNEMRIRELSPFDTPHGDGRLHPLLDWVCGTLLPAMGRQFRLKVDSHSICVGGSSMGGLAAMYAHFHRPETFGAVIAMSPSLFLGRAGIFRKLSSISKPWFTKVYLDAGGQEAGGRLLQLAERLQAQMRAQNWQSFELLYHPVKTGQHNEKHWRRRMPRALKWVYG